MEDISTAVWLAIKAHGNQKRKATGLPYIGHPARVMRDLARHGIKDTDILCAAILHDVLEDTDCTYNYIFGHLNRRVADLVQEVTNDPALSKADQKRAQVTKASTMSRAARQIKMADMVDNLSDLLDDIPPGWTLDRTQGYFIWKMAVWEAGLRGFIPGLDAWVELLPSENITVDGETHPAIPPGDNTERLEAYYRSFE